MPAPDGPTIGVVGVGRMGAPVLARLRTAFRTLAVDIDPDRERSVGTTSTVWHAELADLARAADVLVTVLPGTTELQQVVPVALDHLGAGALWLDLTSGDPVVTRALAAAADARGIDVVSAPMGGSVPEATAGTLAFFTGGSVAAVARARPLLEVLAHQGGIRSAGERPEDAQTVKLLANALWFANVAAAAEALLVGRALGLEPDRLQALLQQGAGGSVALGDHVSRLLDGDYSGTFGIDRVVEELDTVHRLASSAGVPTRSLDASAELHRDALAAYGPALGELLGIRLLEDRAGHRLRRSAQNDGDGDTEGDG